MKKLNSRAKGADGERELSEFLRSKGWPARRGQQRSGLDQADVIDGPRGWHFECKRVEHVNIWKAFEQATRDAGPGETPAVATRRNRSIWLAVIDLETLLNLIRMHRDFETVEKVHDGFEKLKRLDVQLSDLQSAAHREIKDDPIVVKQRTKRRTKKTEERDFLAEVLGGS